MANLEEENNFIETIIMKYFAKYLNLSTKIKVKLLLIVKYIHMCTFTHTYDVLKIYIHILKNGRQ